MGLAGMVLRSLVFGLPGGGEAARLEPLAPRVVGMAVVVVAAEKGRGELNRRQFATRY